MHEERIRFRRTLREEFLCGLVTGLSTWPVAAVIYLAYKSFR